MKISRATLNLILIGCEAKGTGRDDKKQKPPAKAGARARARAGRDLRFPSSAREPIQSAEATSLFRPDCLVSSREVSRRDLP
jgi:hypothetical protein